MINMVCPVISTSQPELNNTAAYLIKCLGSNCMWWCNTEGCAIKLIALQLVKIEEKMG